MSSLVEAQRRLLRCQATVCLIRCSVMKSLDRIQLNSTCVQTHRHLLPVRQLHCMLTPPNLIHPAVSSKVFFHRSLICVMYNLWQFRKSVSLNSTSLFRVVWYASTRCSHVCISKCVTECCHSKLPVNAYKVTRRIITAGLHTTWTLKTANDHVQRYPSISAFAIPFIICLVSPWPWPLNRTVNFIHQYFIYRVLILSVKYRMSLPISLLMELS